MKKFKLLSALLAVVMTSACLFSLASCKKNKAGLVATNVKSDKFRITVACQSEQSESKVLELLAAAFEAKNPTYDIEIKTFAGKDFNNYMQTNFANNIEKSPHIVWTADYNHAAWHRYFTDLRPFYERDLANTDYSLYYETMLDTAALNGEFRPTANYKGTFRADKKDTATGTEYGSNHSQYGIYYAPRDYNKPAIICNTALIKELDADYEKYMGSKPADYVSIEERLNDIVAGNDWNELDDLISYSRLIAERVNYVINACIDAGQIKRSNYWETKYAIDLKLNWEPTYVTFLNAMGIDTMFNADGTLSLDKESAKLEELHSKLYAVDRICNSDSADTDFNNGYTFMKVVSRPVVLGIIDRFTQTYGSASLQCVQIPVQDIAAGNSGYAINYYYSRQTVTVGSVTKNYLDICWDFIKYIITTEGQEVAGESGSNIPVLKSLYEDGAWRHVPELAGMNHEAWVAGGALKQDWYNIYNYEIREKFRNVYAIFFTQFAKENYGEGSLSALFTRVKQNHDNLQPKSNLR